jgi:hypothetical protein
MDRGDTDSCCCVEVSPLSPLDHHSNETDENAIACDDVALTKEFHRYDWLQNEPGEASIDYFDRSSCEMEEEEDGCTVAAASTAVLNSSSHPNADMDNTSRLSLLDPTKNTAAALLWLEQDTLVRVGGPRPRHEEFRHCSAMLMYASRVLAHHMRPVVVAAEANNNNQDDNKFVLDIFVSHKSPAEWKAVAAFLEPRSVQAAAITPSNLPTLLPWFQRLELTVLLQECDDLLASLEWPRTRAAASSDDDDDDDDERFEADTTLQAAARPMDVADLLVLTRITAHAHLPNTRKKCLQRLSSYLEWQPALFVTTTTTQFPSPVGPPPPLDTTNVHDNNGTRKTNGRHFTTTSTTGTAATVSLEEQPPPLDWIHSLAIILLQDDARQALWRSVIQYLPTDLEVYTDAAGLVQNALFSFLLREGLVKAAHERQQRQQHTVATAAGTERNTNQRPEPKLRVTARRDSQSQRVHHPPTCYNSTSSVSQSDNNSHIETYQDHNGTGVVPIDNGRIQPQRQPELVVTEDDGNNNNDDDDTDDCVGPVVARWSDSFDRWWISWTSDDHFLTPTTTVTAVGDPDDNNNNCQDHNFYFDFFNDAPPPQLHHQPEHNLSRRSSTVLRSSSSNSGGPQQTHLVSSDGSKKKKKSGGILEPHVERSAWLERIWTSLKEPIEFLAQSPLPLSTPPLTVLPRSPIDSGTALPTTTTTDSSSSSSASVPRWSAVASPRSSSSASTPTGSTARIRLPPPQQQPPVPQYRTFAC